MHPLAFPNNNGFRDQDGNDVRAGDKVLHTLSGRTATLDEALHDGDAFVTFDDGTHDTVKWNHLRLAERRGPDVGP